MLYTRFCQAAEAVSLTSARVLIIPPFARPLPLLSRTLARRLSACTRYRSHSCRDGALDRLC